MEYSFGISFGITSKQTQPHYTSNSTLLFEQQPAQC